jgi:hypothetical protein
MIPEIHKLVMDNLSHMSSNATTYNNLLSFASVGVSNDTGGGFEKGYRGNHSITCRGRTYHCFHPVDPSKPPSGLGLMFFENSSAPGTLIESRNEAKSKSSTKLSEEFLVTFVMSLAKGNKIARELKSIGLEVWDISGNFIITFLNILYNFIYFRFEMLPLNLIDLLTRRSGLKVQHFWNNQSMGSLEM